MRLSRNIAPTWMRVLVCLCAASVPGLAQGGAQVQRVRVLKSSPEIVEIEIQTTQPIAPVTQEVSDPDRLVLDFPQSTLGPQLHAVGVNREAVKGVRVGLFSTRPPTTRIVLDLTQPVNYKIFPSGNTVIVKLGDSIVPEAAAGSAATPMATPPEPPKPTVTVTFKNGLLAINAEKANLAQVLNEIHKQTGAEVDVPPGAEQEPVLGDLGPGAPKDVLRVLLNGSPYNFILVGSSSNPNALERILLSGKDGTMNVASAPSQAPAAMSPQPATMAGRGLAPVPDPAAQQVEQQPPPQVDEPPADEPPPVDPPNGGAPPN